MINLIIIIIIINMKIPMLIIITIIIQFGRFKNIIMTIIDIYIAIFFEITQSAVVP